MLSLGVRLGKTLSEIMDLSEEELWLWVAYFEEQADSQSAR